MAKPTKPGERIGDISEDGEYMWLGSDIGWQPTDEHQAVAERPLDI